MKHQENLYPISQRFRGFLPVVVDIESGGFNAQTDALLEIAIVILEMDDKFKLSIKSSINKNITPFVGSVIEPSSLEFTGINPHDSRRIAIDEVDALRKIFLPIRREISRTKCTRAILVGHNAHFDLAFMNAAIKRTNIKRSPFHPFSCFDTSSLAGLAYGQTVLAKACRVAGIGFSNEEAHSALYDAIKTAELFCQIVNLWRDVGGWKDQKFLD
ncbi:MAG: ribonuclease T [Cellvibrionales bacterium TMED49]|nr:ribonuclease T [Porticoccaceae bacterium]OUU39315.1 MAG: ribonuclease T [Cellvibrionales bacterium TMED49]